MFKSLVIKLKVLRTYNVTYVTAKIYCRFSCLLPLCQHPINSRAYSKNVWPKMYRFSFIISAVQTRYHYI